MADACMYFAIVYVFHYHLRPLHRRSPHPSERCATVRRPVHVNSEE